MHSLLDGYPKIATFPGFCLLNFFDPQILKTLFPANIFEKSNWQQNLIQKFIQIFAMSFDGDAKGYLSDLGNFFGLCQMGNDGNQILRVNKTAFADFLLNELKNRQKISVAGFFILVHFAYEFAIGRLNEKSQKSIIFYNPHVFNSKNLHKFCVTFPNAKYLNIIREPINMLESSARLCINAIDPMLSKSALAYNLTPKNLLEYGGKDLYFAWKFMLREFSIQNFSIELFLRFGFEKSATIRLEDIKNNQKTALLNLLAWFDIKNPEWNNCLTKETFAGFLYGGISQNNIKGFDNSHLKKQGTFFSENDLRIMNLLLYPISVKFAYRQKDDQYLDSEIFWYENQQKIETYMDFERKIIERLKQDFPNLENSAMMAPYFYRVKYAKRNINFMKKYRENCVGFADLLQL